MLREGCDGRSRFAGARSLQLLASSREEPVVRTWEAGLEGGKKLKHPFRK